MASQNNHPEGRLFSAQTCNKQLLLTKVIISTPAIEEEQYQQPKELRLRTHAIFYLRPRKFTRKREARFEGAQLLQKMMKFERVIF